MTINLSIDKFNKKFWFSKIDGKDQTFLHITDWWNLEFSHLHICTITENKILEDMFATHLSKFNEELEFIIPIKTLYSVDINDYQSWKIINSEENCKFIREIWNTHKISCKIDFTYFLENIDKFRDLQFI